MECWNCKNVAYNTSDNYGITYCECKVCGAGLSIDLSGFVTVVFPYEEKEGSEQVCLPEHSSQ